MAKLMPKVTASTKSVRSPGSRSGTSLLMIYRSL
jgi:hypothetical protein